MVQKIFWTALCDNIQFLVYSQMAILQNLNSGGGRGHFEYAYISFPLSHDKAPQG